MKNIKNILKRTAKNIVDRYGYEIVKRQPPPLDFKSLLSLLFYKDPKDFFFIQVGANDGKHKDPIYELILKYNLSGLLIEPLKNPFDKLRENYKNAGNLIFENVAISDKDGTQLIYAIKKDFWEIYEKTTKNDPTLMSSFDKNHVRRFIQRGMGDFFKDKTVDDYIDSVEVKTATFGTLLNRHSIGHIDLLQIDTEGFDFEIIKLFDFKKYMPKIINYEHTHLRASEQLKCEFFLQEKGYLLLRSKGGDTCAIKQ